MRTFCQEHKLDRCIWARDGRFQSHQWTTPPKVRPPSLRLIERSNKGPFEAPI